MVFELDSEREDEEDEPYKITDEEEEKRRRRGLGSLRAGDRACLESRRSESIEAPFERDILWTPVGFAKAERTSSQGEPQGWKDRPSFVDND